MAHNVSRDGSDPIDLYVGLCIRALRNEKGISQDALGRIAGVTYQQMQKYERGGNRVAASVLVKIARGLRCSIADLLPAAEDLTSLSTMARLMEIAGSIAGVESIVDAYSRITSKEEQQVVIGLAAVLAKRGGPPAR